MKKEKCENAGQFGICPYVTSQQLLSGKWVILILHQLSSGPKRFGELQQSIDITQATLSSQLKTLQKEGLVNRKIYPEVPPRTEYSLTDIGRSFQPVLDAIEKWGYQYIDYLKENRQIHHASV